MNYVVELEGGERWEVSIDPDQPSQVQVEGSPREVQLESHQDGTLLAQIDGRVQAVRLKYEDGSLVVETPDGRRRKARVEKASTAAWRKQVEQHVPTCKPLGSGELRAPIAGCIVEWLVADGTSVERGQPVLKLEAMKMVNTIGAPCSGAIRLVATPGQSVPTGSVLARIVSQENRS